MDFTIHTTVSDNSLPYANYLVSNYTKMASKNDTLKFKMYCLDQNAFDVCSKNYESKFVGIFRGSYAHALSIKNMLSNFDDAINVIADADTVIVKNNWTSSIREICEKYDCVGGYNEEIGGFSSGDGKEQMYKLAPGFTWIAFRNGLKISDFDPLPAKQSNLKIDNEFLSKIYGLPIGYELFRDVAWSYPEYMHKNSINYTGFFNAKSSKTAKVVKNTNTDYHEEFQYNNEPFVCHQRGSMKHNFRTTDLSKNFYNACENYLNSQKL